MLPWPPFSQPSITADQTSPLQMERSHLLSSDDPYNPNNPAGYAYGGTSQSLAQRHLNPEEAKREQEALENITRWTTE